MPISTTTAEGIADIVIDQPPVNALDAAGWFHLARTVREQGAAAATRVVVISARGRGFCAGVDIKELAADPDKIVAVNRANYDSFAAIYDCPVPVIVAAHGFVLGGGVGIAGAGDIVVASDDATFGLPEIDRGAMGAATHLMRLVSIQKARRMFYTGEPATAQELYRHGSIEAVVPADEVLHTAHELAQKIAEKSPHAVRIAKEALRGIDPVDIKRSYRFEQGFTFELHASPVAQEARNAFVEGRDARYET